MANALLKAFQERGTAHSLTPLIVFPLSQKGAVFAVAKGKVNLFVVKKGEPIRWSFCRTSLSLLFSVDSAAIEYDLAAIAEGEATLYQLSEEEVDSLVREEREFAPCLDSWVSFLSLQLNRPIPETIQKIPFSPEPLSIEKGQTCFFRKETWIEVLEGKLLFLGEPSLSILPEQGFFPLGHFLWVKAEEETRIRPLDTEVLIREGQWRKGLTCFSTLFSQLLPSYIEQREKEDLTHLASRTQEQEQNFKAALQQIESVFQRRSFWPFLKKQREPLEQACQIIGQAMDIEFYFHRHERISPSHTEAVLQGICDRSSVRMRKVVLKGEWWKKDQGPLLGFYGETPIALLYTSGGYEMVSFEQKRAIVQEIAKRFSPIAYVFYRPFDSKAKMGKEVLGSFLKQHKKICIPLFLYSFLGGMISLLPPVITKFLFSFAIPESSFSLILDLSIGFLFAAGGYAVFYFLRNLSFLKAEGLAAHAIQTALWDRLLRLPVSFFRRFTAGNLFWRVSAVEEIRKWVSGNASILFFNGVFAFFYLINMVLYAPQLAAIVFTFSLIGIGITTLTGYFQIELLRKLFEIQGEMRGALGQMIGGLSKLRLGKAEKSAFAYWASSFAKAKALQLRSKGIQAINGSLSQFLPFFTTGAVYFALMGWLEPKAVPLDNFLAFQIAFGSFCAAVYPLNDVVFKMFQAVPLWERTRVLFETPLEEETGKIIPGKLIGHVRVDEVVFSYEPNQPPILNAVSLEAPPHSFIGIVGHSGSGKSTLVRLLLGFEKPVSGAVYYDGKDFASLNPREVRKQIGAVFQGGGIIAGSIYQNLTCGRICTVEQLEQALSLSGFGEDLETLPMGLHTILTMNGETLSGGQRQRLLLARAFLGNPSILIFDEATSSLDNRAQDLVIRSLDQLNATRIIIAQRLNTVRNADQIYVLNKGRIAQMGTFDSLAQTEGIFQQMLMRQRL